jgi:O-antigen ligase
MNSRQVTSETTEASNRAWRGDITPLYERYGATLAVGAAFFLPLKLAVAYIFLLPLTALWLVRLIRRRTFPSLAVTAATALVFFLLVVVVSGLCGLSPLHSSFKASRFAFYACTVFVFAELRGANILKILGALILGQTIAAIHTVIAAAFPAVPEIFLGAVTESGQINLTLLITLGVLLALNRMALRACGQGDAGAVVRRFRQERRHAILLGALNFFLLIALTFAPNFRLDGSMFSIVALAALGGTALALVNALQLIRLNIPFLPRLYLGIAAITPLLLTALLVNLKRGPWLGVLIGAGVFLGIHARRYLVPAIGLALILIVALAPLRTRLAQSSEHFFIAGGRQVIWEVGGELALRYPLGIGYENSRILRDFSLQIPPELVHFHNNFLQILVESGWLGLGVYLWWIYAVIALAFRPHPSRSESLVCAAIGCAIIGWQIAGMVEYNLGDNEVALIAFLAVGLLIKLKSSRAGGALPL